MEKIEKNVVNLLEKIKDVVVVDPEKLNKEILAFKKDGIDKIHVLADFDRTITKAFVNGEYVSSIISMLRKHKYLTPDYPEKAQALFEKYHSQELDPRIPNEKKKVIRKKMNNILYSLKYLI